MSTAGTSGPNGPIRVAVDVMGGDYAPRETVMGALEAARGGFSRDLPRG